MSEAPAANPTDGVDPASPPVQRTESPRKRTIMAVFRLGILFAMAAAMIALFKYTPVGDLLSAERTGVLLERLGPAAYPLWILLYALLIGLWIPGTPLTALGAAVFGPTVAIPLNYLGAVLGAVVGFLIARVVGGRAVEDLLAHRVPLYRRYERLLSRRGFEAMFYLRLIPTPYTVLSYVAGLSPTLTLGKYTLATALGILPGSIATTYLMGSLFEAARAGDWSAMLSPSTLLAFGGYAVAASLPAFVAVARSRWGWFSRVAAVEEEPESEG